MIRFKRASHVIDIVNTTLCAVPKYRLRVLQGPVGKDMFGTGQEREKMHREQLQVEPGRGPSQMGR
jgi:hypothetical protein